MEKIINANGIIDGYFLDAQRLYAQCFNELPNIVYIGNIDSEKAFKAVSENMSEHIRQVYRKQSYQIGKKKFQYDIAIVVMEHNTVLELEGSYCNILHDNLHQEYITQIVSIVSRFNDRQRAEPQEINLIVQNKNHLDLKPMEIKRTKLDLGLFYEDDLKETDAAIQRRLKKKNDKGIVLLHGLPGSGKTTYLRYLVGRIKKRVLFLSPSVAGNLMNPDFIELLVDNPNTVLVIEDAESIIMDRRYSTNAAVSNLLNISDGLLADFLNVQLVCTFNNSLTTVDGALLRKGRLIARYEFGKLSVAKAQRLSNYFGYDKIITEPMTIAEIAHPNEKSALMQNREVIGFRRSEVIEG